MITLKEKILTKDPHKESLASLIQLHKQLILHSPYHDGYRGWLRYRNELLTKWLEKMGDLVCEYCGRPNLQIDGYANSPDLCTLDHVIARFNGGKEMDESNLVVACHKCNQRKGTKDYLTFKTEMTRIRENRK